MLEKGASGVKLWLSKTCDIHHIWNNIIVINQTHNDAEHSNDHNSQSLNNILLPLYALSCYVKSRKWNIKITMRECVLCTYSAELLKDDVMIVEFYC